MDLYLVWISGFEIINQWIVAVEQETNISVKIMSKSGGYNFEKDKDANLLTMMICK